MAAAMEYYKDKVPELNNCEASIAFVKRIDQVVDAMNSQIPKDALRPDPESIHNKLNSLMIYDTYLLILMNIKYNKTF